MQIARRIAYFVIGILLVVLLPFVALFVLNGSNDYELSDILESSWGIVLPAEADWTEVYHADSGASFHGDGERYHVIAYKHEDAISNMVKWTNQEGSTRWNKTYQEASDLWLRNIESDTAHDPIYDGCKYWYQVKSDGSEIIMLWNAAEQKIYIVESFL